ncbi:MAG: hydroxymethylglutaryl-CoA synthase family protein [Cenarchaeum sp. SB0665_bin_23]|nr:hydroxymethylglutaryl-CoA synthase family protein [Cenarchaeum sp. SB0667_bin_13]MXY37347.1 hydroxymethylglutaryl-CoA synthase family protein [Cenarchaeum sp. SB0664_bin_35]MXY61703.1 hydroxymethylglutaryl-CoA synthase family protein [Cenarchaeum sp. SB0665_bin_23]MXZ94268.1 hydroxymethylglutaryl-CoA synthase family protein [Cenarchaeum sp. SB0666_bin_15]MYB46825.1 hydroxymethylglutaryl-CoA synthase family protein [Cenarchaeum sp. SB0662_bin_33]MYC79640.1 hydroxymethylglutaryl-CoA synthase 
MAAGIDDMSIYIPKLYVDTEDFAEARDVDIDKMRKGLGIYQMAIVDNNQDPACLAANAAYKIMKRNDIQPKDVGRLYISTESSFDESKAMNAYVVGMLEQVYGPDTFEHCGGVETKFACVSGSYALYDNLNWIRAGEADSQYALVVVSDIAKYDLGSSGEMTQGAGAVAMLLNDEPRLLTFDRKVTATSISDEYDFYRPFGKDTPIVHGQYSNLLYLMQVRKALELYKTKVISTGLIKPSPDESILDYIDYLNMHLPYSAMGRKALAYLLRHEWRNLPRWGPMIEKIGMAEPIAKTPGTIETILANPDFIKDDSKFNRLLMETDEFNDMYEEKLSSSLIASKMIGNLYTASLYLGFRSSLEYEHKKGIDLAGKRIGFGSYGSGSSAMVFSGVITEEYLDIVSHMELESDIANRRRLTLEEYEMLHRGLMPADESLLSGKDEFILTDVDKSNSERRYAFNS